MQQIFPGLGSMYPGVAIHGYQHSNERTNVVIKPADYTGEAVVVWDRDLYLQEPERLLSYNNFYQRVDRDLTMEHQTEVISVVQNMPSQRENSQSQPLI